MSSNGPERARASRRRRRLQRVLLVYAGAVLLAAGWFWSRQVVSVLELLRLAYG